MSDLLNNLLLFVSAIQNNAGSYASVWCIPFLGWFADCSVKKCLAIISPRPGEAQTLGTCVAQPTTFQHRQLSTSCILVLAQSPLTSILIIEKVVNTEPVRAQEFVIALQRNVQRRTMTASHCFTDRILQTFGAMFAPRLAPIWCSRSIFALRTHRVVPTLAPHGWGGGYVC